MSTYQLWHDRELAELIRSEPGLIAIADALAEADPRSVGRKPRSLPRRRWLLAAAALAAAAFAALVVPWSGTDGGGLSARALAAIGTQPVLHVLIEMPSNEDVVDLGTGKSTPVRSTTEIWFDGDKGLKHTLMRFDGVIVGDVLETPEGAFTEAGPVYDCAWIAAHPQEATKLRVSCNADMQNGTTPRQVERPKAAVDPPLAAFLGGYRDAVARGAAKRVDGGELDGKQVVWLSFTLDDGRSEEVALDPKTYRPLYVRMPGGGWEYRILSIGSIGRDDADFSRPKVDERAARIGSGGVFDRSVVDLTAASLVAAYPKALWAGPATSNLSLVSIERDELTSKYGNGDVEHGVGIRLVYGSAGADGKPDYTRPFVELTESDQPQPAYTWGFVRGALPAEGTLLVPKGGSRGFTVVNGVYVSILASSPDLLIPAARALRPVSPQ